MEFNCKHDAKLQVAQKEMKLCMLRITTKDRMRNTEIRAGTKISNIIIIVKKHIWNWAGHIAIRQGNRWTKVILNWYLRDQKGPKKRPNMRWVDEITQFTGHTWMEEA